VALTGALDDVANAYEAAGVIWSSAQTISKFVFVNGNFNSSTYDGVFDNNFGLQSTSDGTTWTTVTGWSLSPAYAYDQPSAGGQAYTFTGPALSVRGLRAVGQVHSQSGNDSWYVIANEVEAFAGSAEMLAGTPLAGSHAASLTQQQLDRVEVVAIADWAATGLSAAQIARLRQAQFVIASLPAGMLGDTVGNVIYIDPTAQGYGWSLGARPLANRVDLLTVVGHELGHILGLPDVDPQAHPGDVMDDNLPPGVRRLPTAYDASLVLPQSGSTTAQSAAYLAELLTSHR
jgi:hypothetical protein